MTDVFTKNHIRKIFLPPKCTYVHMCACVRSCARVSRSPWTLQYCLITLQINSRAPNYDYHHLGGHSRGHDSSITSSRPRPSPPQRSFVAQFGWTGVSVSTAVFYTHTHTKWGEGGFIVSNVFLWWNLWANQKRRKQTSGDSAANGAHMFVNVWGGRSQHVALHFTSQGKVGQWGGGGVHWLSANGERCRRGRKTDPPTVHSSSPST